MLSELLTNNAAGAIMYPIAAIAGEKRGQAWVGLWRRKQQERNARVSALHHLPQFNGFAR